MTTDMTTSTRDITVELMCHKDKRAVIDVLARALRDNPSTIGMFGADPATRLRKLRILYGVLVDWVAQPPYVARYGDRIVGAAAVSPPDTCINRRLRPRVRQVRIIGRDITLEAPSISFRDLIRLLRLGTAALNRSASMSRPGTKHDPATPHFHVELLGVDPDLQGQGIGSALMKSVLRQSDASGVPAYVETDTIDNVGFYGHLGFDVVAEASPLGVHSWYMQRPLAAEPKN